MSAANDDCLGKSWAPGHLGEFGTGAGLVGLPLDRLLEVSTLQHLHLLFVL